MKHFVRINLVVVLELVASWAGWSAPLEQAYPGAHWEARTPEEVKLSSAKLTELQNLVGGRGCVVRNGFMVFMWGDQSKSSDVASAFKPLLSTLLFMAVQEGRIRS